MEQLNEVIITLGKKLYPKDNNVVAIGGGAGSGKGHVISNLLGLEGRILDVDQLKILSQKCKFMIEHLEEAFGKKRGSLKSSDIDLGNPEHTSKLHDAVKAANIQNSQLAAMVKSIVATDRKPNIIYDVTLKDMQKFENLSRQVTQMGYDKRNFHIVWCFNDFKVATQQNQERDRRVSQIVLKATHEGAFRTMNDLVNMGEKLRHYMDGDIWVVFNKRHEDSVTVKSGNVSMDARNAAPWKTGKTEGSYILDANMFKIKSAGNGKVAVPKEVINKMLQYSPK